MHLDELLLLCLEQGGQLRSYQLRRLASRHVYAEQQAEFRWFWVPQGQPDAIRRTLLCALPFAVACPPAIFCPPDHVCSGKLFHAFRNDMTLQHGPYLVCWTSSLLDELSDARTAVVMNHLVPLRVTSYSSPMYTCASRWAAQP